MTEITCSACGAAIATSEDVRPAENRLPVGQRVELAPGFVNARQRHRSGLPWYVRSAQWPDRRMRVARLPAVATCRCGRDVDLPRGSALVRDVARGTVEAQERRLDELLRLAAGGATTSEAGEET